MATPVPTGTAGSPAEADVVDVLSADHSEFLALVEQIQAATDDEQRRDLADTLISELVRHAIAEEMFVYPAIRQHVPDGDAAVADDVEEHQDLERTMKDLEGVEPSDARFDELVRHLEQTLRHHIHDEEAEQFPQLRAHIPREELVRIAGKVDAAKEVAPTRPHPGAPNHQLFHKTVGPGVGLVDRLRDRLTGGPTH
jgi:hemerythrin-like domain-containing protein